MLYVLIAGNLSDGFKVYGPFDSFDTAAAFGDGLTSDPFGSWIMELHSAVH